MDSNGAKVGSIYYDLSLDDAQFQAGATRAKTTADDLATHIGSVGKNISDFGSKLMPASLGAAAALGLAAKTAMDFDQSMELIHTQAGATQKEVDNLTQAVLKLAPAVGQTPDELAKGLFFIESAGFRGAAAMDILKLSAEGAAVGQTTLAETANALTSAMNSGIEGTATATESMGNLNAIVGAGKMHFEDLNAAISTGFLTTFKTFGVSLQAGGAALAELTRQGVPAVDAATRLKMAVTLMAAPTDASAKALQGMGMTATDATAATSAMTDALAKAHITTTSLADDLKKPNGISVAMQDLNQHLKDSGMNAEDAAATIARAFGGARTAGPILTLMQNTQDLNTTFQQIQQTSGDFANSWAAQQQQAKEKMADFKAELSVLAVQLGNSFLPAIESVAKQLGEIANAFGKLSPFEKQAILDAIMFTAALGPLLKVIGSLTTVSGFLVGGLEKLAVSFGMVEASGAGLGTVATAAVVPMGAMAAAIAPLAIGIAAVAAVGIGATVIINRLATEHRNAAAQAQAQATSEQNAAKQLLTTAGAHAAAVTAVTNVANATRTANDAVKDLADKQAAAKTATDNYKSSQDAVAKALAKYGENSPQYIKAVEQEASMAGIMNTATSTLTGSINTASNAHSVLSDAVKKLGANYTVSQLLSESNKIASNGLSKAKSAETDAHSATTQAAKNYIAAVQIFGPNSQAAADASKNLTEKQKDEADKATSVAYWQGQVNQLHKDGPREAQNLANALNPLISQYHNLAGAANDALGKEQNAINAAAGSRTSFQPFIPGHAKGVRNFGGGLSIVGEEGPELLYLPQGSNVIPNNELNGIMSDSNGSSGNSTPSTVNFYGDMIIQKTADAAPILKKMGLSDKLVSSGLSPL